MSTILSTTPQHCCVLAEGGRYLYFHVGDGIIAACDKSGNCRILSEYVHEIAPNYTTFVTIEGTDYNFHRGKDDISAFLLISDGPEEFLKYGDVLTRKGDLLAMLSYFYSGEAIALEMADLTKELKKNGMNDDASFAVIADKCCAGDVFYQMDSDSLEALFAINESESPLTKVERSKIRKIFNVLANQESASEKHLGDALRMHKHSDKIFDKLKKFMERDIIILHENNHYTFP